MKPLRIQQVYCTWAALQVYIAHEAHIQVKRHTRYAGESDAGERANEGPSVYYLRTPNFPLSAASLAPF